MDAITLAWTIGSNLVAVALGGGLTFWATYAAHRRELVAKKAEHLCDLYTAVLTDLERWLAHAAAGQEGIIDREISLGIKRLSLFETDPKARELMNSVTGTLIAPGSPSWPELRRQGPRQQELLHAHLQASVALMDYLREREGKR